jgi:hypothetical protein
MYMVDKKQCSMLMSVFQKLPDPRHKRGQRYAWPVLLVLVSSAVMAGQQGVHAMADWLRLHVSELGEHVPLPRGCAPSEATVRRVLFPAFRIGHEGIVHGHYAFSVVFLL